MTLSFNNNKKNWHITEEGSGYVLSTNDFKSFSKTWKDVVDSSLYISPTSVYETLLINDGSQLIYNSITSPTIATLVDPYCYDYTKGDYLETLSTTDYKNTIDTLGNTRKLTLIDDSFEEAYEDCLEKNKYDLIFITVKNQADVSLKNIERYFSLLRDFGCLFIQQGANIESESEAEAALDHYFAYLSIRVRSSTSGVSQSFKVFRKIQGLI